MVVDVHAHCVPPGLEAAAAGGVADGAVTAFRADGDLRFRFGDGRLVRKMPTPLLADLDQRLGWMDEHGIEHQVVGPWPDIFAYHLDGEAGAAWCRTANAALAEGVVDSDRMSPLAMLPMQAPEDAAEVLRESATAGFVGAMIEARIEEHDLDDPRFEPVWQAAAATALPIVIHPRFCDVPRLQDYGLINTVGRGNDTVVAAARLLFAGVPQRHPGLKLVLSHGGGGLPFLLGRLRRNHELHPDTADPIEGFAALYFDSVVFDPVVLEFLCRVATPGHVTCGSDYPFPMGDLDPAAVVRAAALDAATIESILVDGAVHVFDLEGR